MAKLYLFGIGGTGSRVIKAFTYLLASGVELGNEVDTIVPMIIDPDGGNGDFTRTTELLDQYKQVNKYSKDPNGFFATAIKTLSELTGHTTGGMKDEFKMLQLDSAQNETFRDFIGYSSLPEKSKSLVELLFSDQNLRADMTEGFKGHPNIGSVVLNQFKNSPEYLVFINSFAPGDSIFIISSIFGGTGAAGFPLLLRNLRKEDADLQGSKTVADSVIGALSMMPYFKVSAPEEGKEHTIDSSTFMGKAKAALSYYSNSIFGKNRQLNAFYSLGEDARNFYEHNDGRAEQKNDAHFLELAAALAIVDFTNSLGIMESANGAANRTIFKEYGVDKIDQRKIKFKSLGPDSKKALMKALSKFAMMSKLNEFAEERPDDFEKSPWRTHLDACYKNDGVYELTLKRIESSFKEWLTEMSRNDVAFDPLEMKHPFDSLLNIIDGYKKDKALFGNPSNGKKLEKEMNKQVKNQTSHDEIGSEYLEIFERATENVVASIIK